MREIFIATRIVYFRPRTVGGPGENRVSRSNSSLASRARKKGGKKNFPIQASACVRFLPRGLMGGWRDKGRRIMRGPPASGAAADGDAIAAFHDRRTIAPPVESAQLLPGYFSGFGVTRAAISPRRGRLHPRQLFRLQAARLRLSESIA